MRTLIKNPTKLLIILERSKGERSIPEMDKVLDRLEAILNWTRKVIHFRGNYLKASHPGEVVGSSHHDSDGVVQPAQAEAEGGSPH